MKAFSLFFLLAGSAQASTLIADYISQFFGGQLLESQFPPNVRCGMHTRSFSTLSKIGSYERNGNWITAGTDSKAQPRTIACSNPVFTWDVEADVEKAVSGPREFKKGIATCDGDRRSGYFARPGATDAGQIFLAGLVGGSNAAKKPILFICDQVVLDLE